MNSKEKLGSLYYISFILNRLHNPPDACTKEVIDACE